MVQRHPSPSLQRDDASGPTNSGRLRAGIKSSVVGNEVEESIRSWARSFRAGALTVEEVQQRFATLDVSGSELAQAVGIRIAEAQRELDAMRLGMCEAGQRAEIGRVFAELERFFALHHAK